MKNILMKFMLSMLAVILMELVLWVEVSLEFIEVFLLFVYVTYIRLFNFVYQFFDANDFIFYVDLA